MRKTVDTVIHAHGRARVEVQRHERTGEPFVRLIDTGSGREMLLGVGSAADMHEALGAALKEAM